jgi:fatty acid amide hydrolase 2
MTTLTERSAVDLAAAISRRQLTSVEVVQAHVDRLRATHQQINAVAADRYETALAEARACDQRIGRAALRGSDPEDLPPLFGVPFTVKESIALQGMPQTAGLLSRKGQIPTDSATAVQRLLDAGAIPVGVTNTSEMTLWIESENPVYGRTNNPYNPTLTAGGSSGGEAAAVAVGGAPFGIGADVGGSIRTPALFCGVFGHKPTSGLVPNMGVWPEVTGTADQMLATGPLTRRAEDLMPLLGILAGEPHAQELGDPTEVTLEGLQVTLVEGTSRRPLGQALRDARERAAGALVSAGANVRRIDLSGWGDALLPYLLMLQDDPASDWQPTQAFLRQSGEPKLGVRELLLGGRGHTFPTRLTVGAERFGRAISTPGMRQKLLARGRGVTEALVDAIGDGVLLHPAHATLAPRHRQTYGRPWLMMPAAVFNMAGVPVTEVPLGLSADGLPIGVQVAAGRGSDHLSIAIALELEAIFGGWIPPSGLQA